MVVISGVRNTEQTIEDRYKYAINFLELTCLFRDSSTIFIDEAGFQVSMRIKWDRSKKWARPYITVTQLKNRNLSVCATMTKTDLLHLGTN